MVGKIIAKKLHDIENAILGAKNNPEIQNRVAALGYTPARMEEGNELLKKAMNFVSFQVSEYSDKYVASAEAEKRMTTTYAGYMITLKVVRVAFKGNPEVLLRFGATGLRSRTLSGWLNESRVFYTNLLNTPDAITVMEKFGYSTQRLNDELQQVNEVANLYVKQLEQKGEAQQSTVDRDKVVDEICNWFSDFRAIARVALYDKPQLLEVLGIVKK